MGWSSGAEALDADLPGDLSDDGPDGPGAQLRSFQRTHNVGTGGCESQGATRWPQKKAVAAAGPSREDPLGQSIRSKAIAKQFGVSKNTTDRIVRPERIGKTKPVAATSIVSSNCRCGPRATHK